MSFVDNRIILYTVNVESGVNLGIITRIEPSYSKSIVTTPLLSFSSEDAVSIETGCMESYTISFTRKQPDIYEEGETSNADWALELHKMIDRWQAETDGLYIKHECDGNPNTPNLDGKHGYIKKISLNMKKGEPEILEGSIQIDIGTMYINTDSPITIDTPIIRNEDEYITLSDSKQEIQYTMLGGGGAINFIDSFTLTGGINDPFECLTLKVPEDRLPGGLGRIFYSDIVPGRNLIELNAMGNGTFVVASCKLSNNMYTLKAYNRAEKLRGYVLKGINEITVFENTPLGWIQAILYDVDYGINYEGKFITNLKSDYYNELVKFKEGTNIWTIVQKCALLLDAKVFFIGDYAYLVRLDGAADKDSDTNMSYSYYFDGSSGRPRALNLYPEDRSDFMFSRVADKPEMGYEGVDTIVNVLPVSYTGDDGKVNATYMYEASVSKFNQYRGNYIDLDLFTEEQAELFAKNYMNYRGETQRSITFTAKEMHRTNNISQTEIYWRSLFPPVTYTKEIYNSIDDVKITNVSYITNARLPRKLVMSNYERQYPEGITTYTFGSIAPVDLSSSTSQIMTSINS